MPTVVKNSKGTVFVGMHFYPGIAGYTDAKGGDYRIFVNEDTIRKMNKSFIGRPVFVDHVNDVSPNVNHLRSQADGWVIDSFFNAADGKHWAKFIVVTDKGLDAVKRGMRLSNCYRPTGFGPGGVWNGITYDKQVLGGEFEHLAIVEHPRYDESKIMTLDEFQAYCDSKTHEVKRFANSSKKGDDVKKDKKGITFFKREKIANSLDIAGTTVLLPKSNREVTIETLCNEADELAIAPPAYMVKVHGEEMSVEELIAKYESLLAERDADDDVDSADDPEDFRNEDDEDDDDDVKNADDDDEDDEDEDEPAPSKTKNSAAPVKPAAKIVPAKPAPVGKPAGKVANAADKQASDKLRNAGPTPDKTAPRTILQNGVAIGQQRYGSK